MYIFQYHNHKKHRFLNFLLFFFILTQGHFVSLLLERGEGREREREASV